MLSKKIRRLFGDINSNVPLRCRYHPMKVILNSLIVLNKTDITWRTVILTDHHSLQAHLLKIGRAENSHSRSCGENNETLEQFICHSHVFANIKSVNRECGINNYIPHSLFTDFMSLGRRKRNIGTISRHCPLFANIRSQYFENYTTPDKKGQTIFV